VDNNSLFDLLRWKCQNSEHDMESSLKVGKPLLK
jgi:hypothetical protein